MTQMINESVTCNVLYCCNETFINVTQKKKKRTAGLPRRAVLFIDGDAKNEVRVYLGKLSMGGFYYLMYKDIPAHIRSAIKCYLATS